jgi:hypothetical protein
MGRRERDLVVRSKFTNHCQMCSCQNTVVVVPAVCSPNGASHNATCITNQLRVFPEGVMKSIMQLAHSKTRLSMHSEPNSWARQ